MIGSGMTMSKLIAGFGRFAATAAVLAFTAATVAPNGALASADPDDARDFIQKYIDQGVALLEDDSLDDGQKVEKARELAAEGFDVPSIAIFVLGRYGRTLSRSKRSDYIDLYTKYMQATYLTRMNEVVGFQVDITKAEKYGGDGDILVESTASRDDTEPFKIGWRVYDKKGELKVLDVLVEGVSLVLTQRQEFTSIITDRGVDGLIELMRKKVVKLEKTAARN